MLGTTTILAASLSSLSIDTLKLVGANLKDSLGRRGIDPDSAPVDADSVDSAIRNALESVYGETAAEVPDPEQLPPAQREAMETAEVASQHLGAAEADRLAADALAGAHADLTKYRDERLRQAKSAFNVAASVSVVGVAVILIGVVLMFMKEGPTAGGITAAVGAVAEIVSLLLFKLREQTSNELRKTEDDLRTLEATRVMITLADKISNPQERDALLREAARALSSRGG